jgi:hypothetical protein
MKDNVTESNYTEDPELENIIENKTVTLSSQRTYGFIPKMSDIFSSNKY